MVLIAGLALLPGTALGQSPITAFHNHFTASTSAAVCGIPVDIDLVVTDNFIIFADGSFKDTSSIKQTFTNPVNGKSVSVSLAGPLTGTSIVDEGAGTITFVTAYKGLPEKIQTAQGPVLLRDAGIMSFAYTLDLETGALISSEFTIKGPNPEADSDFTLFCGVITTALT